MPSKLSPSEGSNFGSKLTIVSRHRRTHEPRQEGDPIVNFSEEEENEDEGLGSLEEESPEAVNDYMPSNLSVGTSLADLPNPMVAVTTMGQSHQLLAASNY